jgi:hypothetical protein
MRKNRQRLDEFAYYIMTYKKTNKTIYREGLRCVTCMFNTSTLLMNQYDKCNLLFCCQDLGLSIKGRVT